MNLATRWRLHGGPDAIDRCRTGGWECLHSSDGHRAFITGPNGVGIRDLGTLGGNYVYVEALGINNAGQVVGYSPSTSDTPHAFITGPNGMGMRDLGTLGGGLQICYGINDAGQVVGFFYPHNWHSATLSSPAPMARILRDLNSKFDLRRR